METTRLHSIPLRNIKVNDTLFTRYIDTVIQKGLAYQWEALNDRVEGAEKSYCIHNMKVAAGLEKGEFGGMVFQDSDLYKWLEGVAFSLEIAPNAELEKIADDVIELMEQAQQPDGYLDTYYIINGLEKRFTDLTEAHELYCAGHMMEAAVAYYNATGKDRVLNIAKRFADLICDTFGAGEGQIPGYPGHPEIEVGLVKLAEATGEQKYLDTAKFFVDARGTQPNYLVEESEARKIEDWVFPDMKKFDQQYYQNHAPVREQDTAEGHAVRNLYLYTAVADVAHAYQDQELLDACKRIYKNIVGKRMFITGGVGSAGFGERFTADYDLPNHSDYAESCASIALAMFAKRMLEIERNGKYADVVERALYNTVLAGTNIEGDAFFYVNPLEVDPEICKKNTDLAHVKPVRQTWFGCACCPPNIVRTLASLGQYIYSADENDLFVNLYVANETECTIGARNVKTAIQTDYPFGNVIKLSVETDSDDPFTVALRIPNWTTVKSLKVGGEEIKGSVIDFGYLKMLRSWKGKTEIVLELDMPARLVFSHPNVRANVGRCAVVKGPLVYCLEEVDNGKRLPAVSVAPDVELTEEYDKDLLGGTMVIRAPGARLTDIDWDGLLYRGEKPEKERVELKFVPYCLWQNRGEGEMIVWIGCEE